MPRVSFLGGFTLNVGMYIISPLKTEEVLYIQFSKYAKHGCDDFYYKYKLVYEAGP